MLPNDFGGHLANWLGKVGYTMPAAAPSFSFDYPGVGATSTHDRGIRFAANWKPAVDRLAGRYGRRGRLHQSDVDTLETLLHEMLHQPLVHREPGWYGAASNDQRLWEEAAAEQAANDLLPAAARQLFGSVMPSSPDQPPRRLRTAARPRARADTNPLVSDRVAREKAYRQWSTLASGSRHFQERPARLKRRAFLNASTDERARMLAAPPLPRPKPRPDRPPGY